MILLLACVAPDAPAPTAPTSTAQPAQPPPGPPGPPGPQGAPPGHPGPNGQSGPKLSPIRMDAQVVEVGADHLVLIGPEGKGGIRAEPAALASVRAGDSVSVVLRFDGAPVIEAVMQHTGLPITYGWVARVSDTEVVTDGPAGGGTFVRNRWSDVPALVQGDWISVKHYAAEGARAILNVRKYPGRVEETGAVSKVEAGAFEVMTLGGPRRYDTAPGAITLGATVTVHYRRTPAGPAELGVMDALAPHSFVGKLSTWDAGGQTMSMVDAWGSTLGVVRFRVPAGLPADLVPGDLAEVRWRVVDGVVTAEQVVERALSPVFFGRIDAMSADSISMTTLQRQPKQLRRTQDTWMPIPVAVGDMADVMWVVDPVGGALVAEAVVKE